MGNYASFYDLSYQYIKEITILGASQSNSNKSETEIKTEIKNEIKNENNEDNKSKEIEYDYEEICIIHNMLINYNNGSISKENILITISDYIEMNTNVKSNNRDFKIIKKFSQQFEDGIYDKISLNL